MSPEEKRILLLEVTNFMENTVPVEVKNEIEGIIEDEEAYQSMLKLSKHPILNEERKVMTSIHREVDLGWIMTHLKTKMYEYGLPEEEQASIIAKKNKFAQIMVMYSNLKCKAFGTHRMKHAGKSNTALFFLKDKKEEIIELFGKMFTLPEVHKVVVKDWKIPLTMNELRSFREKYATIIQTKIEEHKHDFSDMRLGIKKSRLEELVELYKIEKEHYYKTGARESYKLLLQTLEQIRKETEGDVISVNGKVVHSVEDVNAHIRQETLKSVNIQEIILGKVAGRMGIRPSTLISSLENSYYAKYAGVLSSPQEAVKFSYPSEQPYDFDKIRKQKAIEVSQSFQDAVVITEDETATAMSAKEKLLEKLKRKQGDLTKKADVINEKAKNKNEVKIGRPKSVLRKKK